MACVCILVFAILHYASITVSITGRLNLIVLLLRRYQEHGISKKWNSDILQTPKPMRTLFEDYPEQYNHSLTLTNVSGAFFLLGSGLSFALLAFFIEYTKYRRELMH